MTRTPTTLERRRASAMEMFQHDSVGTFEFVLRGTLAGPDVQELEHAWTTAQSILTGKMLLIDLSRLTYADSSGLDLLSRMRESGARLTGALPEYEEILRLFDIPITAPRMPARRHWVLRFLSLATW